MPSVVWVPTLPSQAALSNLDCHSADDIYPPPRNATEIARRENSTALPLSDLARKGGS
jgi:hypothetical protein